MSRARRHPSAPPGLATPAPIVDPRSPDAPNVGLLGVGAEAAEHAATSAPITPAGARSAAEALVSVPAVRAGTADATRHDAGAPPRRARRTGALPASPSAKGSAQESAKAGAKRSGIKIYRRVRATGAFYYGDLRAYADVGGGLEALKAPGAKGATQDFAEASALYAAREAFYRAERAARAAGAASTGAAAPATEPVRLGPFLAEHLRWKAARPHVRRGTIARDEHCAKALIQRLGNPPITAVTPAVLEAYVERRAQEPGVRRGKTVAARSIRAELHTLSHAMRRAVMLGLIPSNPVRLMMSKPPIPTEEAVYLTDEEAARLLAAAAEEDAYTATFLETLAERRAARDAERADRDRRRAEQAALGRRIRGRPPRRTVTAAGAAHPPSGGSASACQAAASIDDRVPFAHALLATYLYTGGRSEEVRGLLVRDIDFVRERVHIRHNTWRKLKRDHHERSVQLWPALAEVLRAHVAVLGIAGDDLLFPSPATGRMLDRPGKVLARCLERARLSERHTSRRVTPHSLRHTFATALLQTLVPIAGGGWAVRSSFDVAKQLGHRSSKLVDDTYGHAVDAPVYREELRYGGRGDRAGDRTVDRAGDRTVDRTLDSTVDAHADVDAGATTSAQPSRASMEQHGDRDGDGRAATPPTVAMRAPDACTLDARIPPGREDPCPSTHGGTSRPPRGDGGCTAATARGARTQRPTRDVAPALPITAWASHASPMLWFVPQQGDDDCGIAALAMLLDLQYDQVARALLGSSPAGSSHTGACGALTRPSPGLPRFSVRPHDAPASAPGAPDRAPYGTTADDLRRAAQVLGFRLRRLVAGSFHARRATGVLGVDRADRPGHWVYLCNGVVYDPSGGIWALREFLEAQAARVVELLELQW